MSDDAPTETWVKVTIGACVVLPIAGIALAFWTNNVAWLLLCATVVLFLI